MEREVYPGVSLRRSIFVTSKQKSVDFATLFLCFYDAVEYFVLLHTIHDVKQNTFLKTHDELLLSVIQFFRNGGSELYILNFPIEKDINTFSVDIFMKGYCDTLNDLEQICTLGILKGSQANNESNNKAIEVIYAVNRYTYDTDRISITDINNTIKESYLDRLGETVIYYPWLFDDNQNLIPPSVIAAALNSKLAHEGFFFHSIANKTIIDLQQLSEDFSSTENQKFYNECINPIIYVHNQGVKIWGIKAFNSHYESVNEMRIIKYIKRHLKRISKKYIFESNSSNLSGKIFIEVNQFLLSLWEIGTLSGNSKKEAFVLNENIKNIDSNRSLLSFDIAVAITKPLEFITIKLNRIDNNGAQESLSVES